MTMNSLDVFINCPFDEAYLPLFESILFTITASGYRARCALEEDNGADIRLDKLCRILGQCKNSIHDLSRIKVEDGDAPRFNMPFELGLVMGAKRFGGRKFSQMKFLIMIEENYKMPIYLSDLAGNDPRAHKNDVEEVVRIVRKFLGEGPSGAPLPGPAVLLRRLKEFQSNIPILAAELDHHPSEIHAFRSYKEYAYILGAYLKGNPAV